VVGFVQVGGPAEAPNEIAQVSSVLATVGQHASVNATSLTRGDANFG
jgi:hypothetical protein